MERFLTDAELERFRSGSEWNALVSQYVIIGSRFVHGNIDVRLYRVFGVAGSAESTEPLQAMVRITRSQLLLHERYH